MKKAEDSLVSMCDERARMLQEQFHVSVNHVHALAILVSTLNFLKQPTTTTMDQIHQANKEKELAAVKINLADVDIIANELEGQGLYKAKEVRRKQIVRILGMWSMKNRKCYIVDQLEEVRNETLGYIEEHM